MILATIYWYFTGYGIIVLTYDMVILSNAILWAHVSVGYCKPYTIPVYTQYSGIILPFFLDDTSHYIGIILIILAMVL